MSEVSLKGKAGSDRCTYEVRWLRLCGRPPGDPIHVKETERMRRGAHVWRHDPSKAMQTKRTSNKAWAR